MRVHGGSFLLGLATAALVPLLTRYFRPLAVQATAAGIAAMEDMRRVMAEQVEVMQDIAAEAKVRREDALATEPDARGNGRRRTTKGRAGATRRPLKEVEPAGGAS